MSRCVGVWLSVCLSVCLSACVSVYRIAQTNGSIHLKLEHIVVHGNSSEDFDIGHCSRSQRDFEIFLHLPQYTLSKDSFYMSQNHSRVTIFLNFIY